MLIIVFFFFFIITIHPSGCEVISHVVLICISLMTNAGRGWGQEEKRTTEDEMAGWYH